MVTLNTKALHDIMSYVGKSLHSHGVDSGCTVDIRVDKDDLKKIDEDIFYTFKKEGILPEDAEFKEQKEIKLNFYGLTTILHT